VVGGIPSAAELGDPPDEDICANELARLRIVQVDLHPTPDLAIDDVVREWVRVAEQAFFECPPSSTLIPDLDSAYEELRRLQAEVEVVLSFDP
jgi:hypothetical protein